METSYAPEQLELEELEILKQRERYLLNILIGTLIVGLVALVFVLFGTTTAQYQIIYTAINVVLLAAILFPFNYSVRAWLLSVVILSIGASTSAEIGIRSEGFLFMYASVVIASILLNTRQSVVFLFVNVLSIGIIGWLTVMGIITPTYPTGSHTILDDWIAAGIANLLLGWITIAGLRMLQQISERPKKIAKEIAHALIDERKTMEERVVERTQELEKRTNQLNATTFVARQTAEIRELNTLLQDTVKLITEQFGFYHSGIFLINERGDYAVLQSASSEGGKQMLERGHRLQVGTQGIVGYVASERQPRIALDVGEEAVYFNNPHLPETRSEVGVPLIVRDKLIGVLDIQSTEREAFNEDDLNIFQTLADQIAIAIENIRLLHESQLVISQLQFVSGESTHQGWADQLKRGNSGFVYSPLGIQNLDETQSIPKTEKTIEIPITLRNRKIGKFKLNRKPDFPKWTKQEIKFATEIASQTALVLDNIRLLEETQSNAQRELMISEISNRVRETLDLETVLKTSAIELQTTLGLEEAEVHLFAVNDEDQVDEQ
jgi:GAF domain-containing protein